MSDARTHVLKYLNCTASHLTPETQFIQFIQLLNKDIDPFLEMVQLDEYVFVRVELVLGA